MNDVELIGRVVSGIGIGKKYVIAEPYFRFFRELLGCDPYPGTLNISVNKIQKNIFSRKEFEGVGSILYLPGKIENIRCVVLIPEKTIHINTIEIVSCINLRYELNLRDGDLVKIICRVQNP